MSCLNICSYSLCSEQYTFYNSAYGSIRGGQKNEKLDSELGESSKKKTEKFGENSLKKGTSKIQGGDLNFSKMSDFQFLCNYFAILPLKEMSENQNVSNFQKCLKSNQV